VVYCFEGLYCKKQPTDTGFIDACKHSRTKHVVFIIFILESCNFSTVINGIQISQRSAELAMLRNEILKCMCLLVISWAHLGSEHTVYIFVRIK